MSQTKTNANKTRMIVHVSQTKYQKALKKTWECGDTCNTKLSNEVDNDPNIPPLEKHAIRQMKMSECKLQDCMPYVLKQLELEIEDIQKTLYENLATLEAIKCKKEIHTMYYRSLLQRNIKVHRKNIRENELFLLKAQKNKVKPIDIVNMFML